MLKSSDVLSLAGRVVDLVGLISSSALVKELITRELGLQLPLGRSVSPGALQRSSCRSRCSTGWLGDANEEDRSVNKVVL